MGAQGLSEPAVLVDRAAGDPHGPPGPRGPYGRWRRARSRGPSALTRLLARGYPVGLAVVDGVAAVTVWIVVAAAAAGPVGLAAPGSGLAVLGLVCANLRIGLYRPPRCPSVLADVRPLVLGMSALALVAAALNPSTQAAGMTGPSGLARTAALWLAGAAAGCAVALLGRTLSYSAIRMLRSGRVTARAALVIGNGPVSAHVAGILRQHPEFGLRPVGCVDTGFQTQDSPSEVPVLGGCDDLYRIMQDHHVGTVVIAAEEVERAWGDAIVRICSALRCETLLVLSPADSLSVAGAKIGHLAGTPFVRLPPPGYSGAWRHLKRAFDVVVSLLALVALLPVLAACAVAVRADTGPGVLFRQRRIGLDGKEFVLLKFRTLRPANEQESDTRWCVDGDERMGRIGKFLRDTCLDELPQLWNVVRGDMSLVGPRPERPHFVQSFSTTCPGYPLRHRVRGGMTGWSQVHGLRGDTSIELRARFDNHYIDTWTFTGDLKVLLMTVRVVLARNRG